MKKIAILLISSYLFLNCTAHKQPTYLGVGDIVITSVSKDSLKLRTTALFRNDNELGGKISTDNMEVFIAGSPVAKVKTKEVDVPAHREFDVPLEVSIPYNKVSGQSMLGGVLNSILTKKNPSVMFRGAVNYKVSGFKASYLINKVQEVNLKK